MTDEELQAIRDRAEKATPGEWHTVGLPWNHEPFTWVIAGSEDPHLGKPVCDCIYIDEWEGDAEAPDYSQSCMDMDFIAHARTDIPKLLDEIERLQQEKNTPLEVSLENVHFQMYHEPCKSIMTAVLQELAVYKCALELAVKDYNEPSDIIECVDGDYYLKAAHNELKNKEYVK